MQKFQIGQVVHVKTEGECVEFTVDSIHLIGGLLAYNIVRRGKDVGSASFLIPGIILDQVSIVDSLETPRPH